MGNNIIIFTGLNQDEEIELQHHLKVIRSSFIQMVKALAIIHSKKLYRGQNGKRTWAEFCRDELNFSERYGYYFVEAFSVLGQIDEYNQSNPNTELPYPQNLKQTKALAKADDIIGAWMRATQKYTTPTAKQISETIQALKNELVMAGVSEQTAMIITNTNPTHITYEIIAEVIQTGYLQIADEVIPATDIRPQDIIRYEDELRREQILQKIAERGGVSVTIYPHDPLKTAKSLIQHIPQDQIIQLIHTLNSLIKNP